ncbi:MAG: bifunctional 4-hydroxy-2-oxoglutarate aldolase/2-dehydro-3-deoxy-phosphogluconate aldolase [Thermodesulfobacteriota bacterium]
MIDIIKQNKIISVIKSDSYENSYNFAQACIDGGIKNIEIISTSPGAKRLIRELSKVNGICIGAGTVLDKEVAKEAIDLGAKFIVCPHTDPEIINFCRENGSAIISGAFTSSEIINAWKLGADMVKIFPSSLLGPKYIKAVKEPLPFVDIFVTGGINLENIGDYFISGAACVGLSTALLGKNKTINYHSIVEISKKFVNKTLENEKN